MQASDQFAMVLNEVERVVANVAAKPVPKEFLRALAVRRLGAKGSSRRQMRGAGRQESNHRLEGHVLENVAHVDSIESARLGVGEEVESIRLKRSQSLTAAAFHGGVAEINSLGGNLCLSEQFEELAAAAANVQHLSA